MGRPVEERKRKREKEKDKEQTGGKERGIQTGQVVCAIR